MAFALAVFTQTIKPGQGIIDFERPSQDIRLTSVVLDADLTDDKRCSLKVHTVDENEEGEEVSSSFVLANLIPGKIEHQPLDIIITADEELKFELTGKNTVHLYGNFIEQPHPHGDFDSEDEFDSDGEPIYNLADVSSDVEMYGDDLLDEDDDADRFEEITETKATKAITAGAAPEVSKKQKKKQKQATAVAKDAAPKSEKDATPAKPVAAANSTLGKKGEQKAAVATPGSGKKDKKKNKGGK